MREKILAHKKGMTILACAFLIFLGCFAFPVYNFSEDAPDISRGSSIVIALLGYSQQIKIRRADVWADLGWIPLPVSA